MKYTDGYWVIKDGVKPAFAMQVAKSSATNDSLRLQVTTYPLRHRGDTLKGPVLDVTLSSPLEGVVGVTIEHFAGVKPVAPTIPLFPTFDKPPAAPSVKINVAGDKPTFSTGNLTVEATTLPYSLTFKDSNKTLTISHPKSQSVIDIPHKWTLSAASESSCMATDINSIQLPVITPKTVRYMVSELNLSPGELIYGFGEQFGPFVKNGQKISIWNQDGGTASEQAYKCVPFYISNRGYGVFINHPGEVEIEVGSEKVSRVSTSVRGERLEYYLITGSNPLDILSKYTQLTGLPSLPPAWTFGLWLSTSFLTDYSSETVSGFLEGMRQRNCHVRVFHMDCFWMKQYEWCSFTFDPENFPNPKAYIAEIKRKYGVKICLWINPYVSQHSPLFKEGQEGGYFIKRTNGDLWQWNYWQPGLVVVDITNPAARDWYTSKLAALLDLGVDCFKTDFGERIPHIGVQFHDPTVNNEAMHNMYSVIYNELVFRLLEKRFGKGEAVLFARSSYAGGQRFPVHWGGDCESTFEAMAETLRGGLSLTSSGFAFTSHDIGGFEGRPPAEVYKRWLGYGLFSSHSRLHGSESYRVPWEYGEEASAVLAKFVETKHRLMPYLYAHAIEASQKGYPVQRATWLEFHSDRTTHTLDLQFMLGPSLLVAPVFGTDVFETEYYLPAGRWTEFVPNVPSAGPRVIDGPRWIKETVPYDVIPSWVRPGSILVLGRAGVGKPDYVLSESPEVRLYELAEGEYTAAVPTGTGSKIAAVVNATRKGTQVNVKIADGNFVGEWKLRVYAHGQTVSAPSNATLVSGVGAEVGTGGTLLQADKGAKEVSFSLQ